MFFSDDSLLPQKKILGSATEYHGFESQQHGLLLNSCGKWYFYNSVFNIRRFEVVLLIADIYELTISYGVDSILWNPLHMRDQINDKFSQFGRLRLYVKLMGMGFLWVWVVYLSCEWCFNECFEESFYLFIYFYLTIAASPNILNFMFVGEEKKLYMSK